MYKKSAILSAALFLTLLFPVTVAAQGVENLVWAKKLEKQIGFLTSPLCEGRAPGTKGGSISAFWLIDQYRKSGLMEMNGSYAHSFPFGDDRVGHNIVGMLPASKKSPRDSYVIIGAHYDNLGKLGDTIYPGADSNASGVAALINLASMFNYMKLIGRVYDHNIIFVAFDAKLASMAGSEALYKAMEESRLTDPLTGKAVTPDKVDMVVNLEQMGSSLSPLRSGRKDFLIMLGNQTMPKVDQDMAHFVNQLYRTDLELAFDYYGSSKFTEVFFRKVTDLKVFVENNIPSILFTSGITMKTNKPDDNVESLQLDVLAKRIIFIYHWIENML